MSIKIISLNVRGLRDPIKRKSIFNFYKKRADIICLQETHSIPEDEPIWSSEFRGDVFFSHGTNNARGVCILAPKGMQQLCSNIHRDIAGRIIKLELQLYDFKITLCNIYAPNKECPAFFQDIHKILEDATEHIIMIGDFNLVMNPVIDRIGSLHNKFKAKAVIDAIAEEFSLVDIWRTKNESERRYSWYKSRPSLSASRIDFAMISQGWIDKCENTGYMTGMFSDHLAFYLFLKPQKNERGSGYWKLNVTHLTNKEYLETINDSLDVILRSYEETDVIKKWEYLKYKIREESIAFSKQCASERELVMAQLAEKVTEMELDIEATDHDILRRTKMDLEEFLQEKTNECIFRSKVRFVEMGEKPTKYYLNLEKSRYNARTCDVLYDETNKKLVTSTAGILKLQESFYQSLYTKDEHVDFNFQNTYDICVSEKLREKMNAPFTIEEISKAVSQLPNNKTCGNDGIPIDFYKVFWGKLKEIFFDVINEVFTRRHLYNSALLGVINLIPKQNQNTRLLKSLRPITLLNSCYKVMEKAIANRIEPALEEIISSDQRGFQKNKRISSNIRTIFELMKQTKAQGVEALLLSLDFLKCFDMIDHSAIVGAMEFFKFPPYLVEWIKIIYKDFKANILNNGHFSKRIKIGRGVHQGGPCSSLLFLICAETMALLIKTHPNIKGIPVEQMMHLLGQYADDADMFLLKDQKSLDSVFLTLERFRQLSGFTLNYDKTTILRIGAMHGSDAIMYTQKIVSWTNEPINVLGVWVSPDTNKILDKNYEELYTKAEVVLNSWRKRTMSLHGKVLIVNNLISSLFVYRMMVLPTMPADLAKKLKNLIVKFIWNNTRPKIAYDFLILPKQDGGLGLVDLELKNKAIKISWIQVLIKERKLESLVFANNFNIIKNLIWKCNLARDDVKLFVSDPFWKAVFEAWFELKDKELKVFDYDDSSEIIWMNSKIRINNKPVAWKDPIKAGLIYVRQLFSDGKVIDIEKAKQFKLTVMELNSLVSAIPKEWRTKECLNNSHHNAGEIFYEKSCNKNNIASFAYRKLIKSVSLVQRIEKWEAELNCNIEYDLFMTAFRKIYTITNIPKYRSFQYRLLHRAILTNKNLYKWNVVSSELCTFCNLEAESYIHLFVYCKYVEKLWLEVESLMHRISGHPIHFNLKTVILNTFVEGNHINNFIGLVCKQYIYRKRCYKELPKIEEFEQLIWTTKGIEKFIAKKNNKYPIFVKKWESKKYPTHEKDSILLSKKYEIII